MPHDPRKRKLEKREGVKEATGWKKPKKWYKADSAEEWRRKELERLNCTKYHYLKFVERQKIERRMKSCKRQLEQACQKGQEAEAEALRVQLRTHLADHEYIRHYPKHLPYNSLFPAQDSEASRKRREEIRKLIREELQKEGQPSALDAELVEPEVPMQEEVPKAKEPGPKKMKKARKRSKAMEKEEVEEAKVQPTKVKDLEEPAPKRAGQIPALGKCQGKVKKKGKAKAVEPELEGPPQAKKVKKGDKVKAKADGQLPLHPSWAAAKNAKVAGAIVSSAGDRKVFDSDSDA
ncbi:unnamed protein product [Effrenium voratum]|nr:unnamed protein product [Effrenium voratum]